MEVYKREGSPSWYVDLVDPVTKNRVRKSLKFTGSKVQAERRARDLQDELEAQVKLAKDGKRAITVGAAVEAYVSRLETQRQPSAKNQRYRMGRLFGTTPATGLQGGLQAFVLDPATPLHEITPAAMEALSLARSREGKKPQTIKHELGLLRAATRYAAGLGFRTPELMTKGEISNPWRVPEVTKKTRYLSVEEFQKVYSYLDPSRPVVNPQNGKAQVLPPHLKAARQETQDLLVALAYTGGRWSEIAHLTSNRINWVAGHIVLWAGKVEKERIVPLSLPLRLVLARRLKALSEVRPAVAREGLIVFPGPGGRPRTKPADGIGVAMDAVGLNDPATVAKFGKATIHSLRHTFASWLIQNGAGLSEVKDALGHATVATTTRYAHLAKGATMAKLGVILSNIGMEDGR